MTRMRTPGDSPYSASSRSSKRHSGVVEKLMTCVNVLVEDDGLEHSSLGVFPGVLEGALSRFLEDVRLRLRRGRSARLPAATSSTRRDHFMDSRDRGPSSRADREAASQASVKARREERDREFINRGE